MYIFIYFPFPFFIQIIRLVSLLRSSEAKVTALNRLEIMQDSNAINEQKKKRKKYK